MQTIPVGAHLKEVLAVAHQTRKPVLLEGPSGIGKSECVRSVAEDRLDVACIALDLSLLEPPDLLGLPVIAKGRTSYATPTSLPLDGTGILLLEELNRAERYIRQPVLQLLSARSLNDYVLPDDWSVVAAVNPQNAGYDVDSLDPALLDRFLRLKVTADRDSWVAWAVAAGVHPVVLELARTHDRLLEGASPRAWKHVSDLLHHFAGDEAPADDLVRACIGGYLPEAWLEAVVATRARTRSSGEMDARLLLNSYGIDQTLQHQLVTLRARGRTDVMERLAWKVTMIVEQSDLHALSKAGAFFLESFERLLDDLPGDYAERAQLAFGSNETAVALLPVKPADVLESYQRDEHMHIIEGWTSQHRRRHRAWALATGVAAFLDQQADLKRVRDSLSVRRNLGILLGQLDYPHDRHFARLLDRLDISVSVAGKNL